MFYYLIIRRDKELVRNSYAPNVVGMWNPIPSPGFNEYFDDLIGETPIIDRESYTLATKEKSRPNALRCTSNNQERPRISKTSVYRIPYGNWSSNIRELVCTGESCYARFIPAWEICIASRRSNHRGKSFQAHQPPRPPHASVLPQSVPLGS